MTYTIDAALSFLSVIGIFYVLFWFIPPVVLESGRQKVFKIRDSIFDYSIEHPDKLCQDQHYAIRSELNKFIVAMEYMTIVRMITGAFFHKKGHGSDAPFSKLYSSIKDDETKEFIKASMKKVLLIVSMTMVLRSPVALMLLTTVGLLVAIIQFISPSDRRTQAKIKSRFKQEVFENLSHIPA